MRNSKGQHAGVGEPQKSMATAGAQGARELGGGGGKELCQRGHSETGSELGTFCKQRGRMPVARGAAGTECQQHRQPGSMQPCTHCCGVTITQITRTARSTVSSNSAGSKRKAYHATGCMPTGPDHHLPSSSPTISAVANPAKPEPHPVTSIARCTQAAPAPAPAAPGQQ